MPVLGVAVYYGLKKLSDTTIWESQRTQAEETLRGALNSLQGIINENTQYEQDQTVYMTKYNARKLVVDEKKATLETAKKAILEQTAKKEKLCRFMRALSMFERDERIIRRCFYLCHRKILIKKGEKDTLVFCFAGGTEITDLIDG